jgi:hypothetical protein
MPSSPKPTKTRSFRQKPQRGRPPVPAIKDQRIVVLVDSTLYNRIHAFTDISGVSVGEFARRAFTAYIDSK